MREIYTWNTGQAMNRDPSTRLHLSLDQQAIHDLDQIVARIRCPNRSWAVRAAVRLFREALERNIATESGQLLWQPGCAEKSAQA